MHNSFAPYMIFHFIDEMQCYLGAYGSIQSEPPNVLHSNYFIARWPIPLAGKWYAADVTLSKYDRGEHETRNQKNDLA